MKKKLLLVLMMTVLLCFTGCSSKKEAAFEYDKDTMIDMAMNVASQYKDVSDAQADYLLSEGNNVDKTAIAGFRQADTSDHVGNFVAFDSRERAEFAEGAHDNILCSVYLKYENRDVKVQVSFVKNKLYDVYADNVRSQLHQDALNNGYEDDLKFLQDNYQNLGLAEAPESVDKFLITYLGYNGQQPYTADECEISAVYSRQELLARAGKHTAIGMITVFCVLIFIALIISLLKFVPKILGVNKKNETAKAAAPAPKKAAPAPVKAETKEENLVDDSELVAVITAAIYAYESSCNNNYTTDSKDKLVVRSIRRVR